MTWKVTVEYEVRLSESQYEDVLEDFWSEVREYADPDAYRNMSYDEVRREVLAWMVEEYHIGNYSAHVFETNHTFEGEWE